MTADPYCARCKGSGWYTWQRGSCSGDQFEERRYCRCVNSATIPAMLDPKLARAIRRAALMASNATIERDRLILEASQTGASLREIAEHAGISHVAVHKIIRRDS